MSAPIKFTASMLTVLILCGAALHTAAWSQETPAAGEEPAAPTDEQPPAAAESAPVVADKPADKPSEAADKSSEDKPSEAIDKAIEGVDESQQARQVSAGVLKPIYTLAEKFSFPAFHWVAFALMVAGVVSFAFQLVLGKLIVLSRMSMSLTEIMSDSLGLAVSLIGLVLTTQAAAENSNFTSSAFAVLSATGAGALAGLVFYIWGQKQELQAVEGRRAVAARRGPPPPSPPPRA